MQLIHQVMIVISTIIIGIIAIYAYKNRKVSGAYPLFIQMVTAVIWLVGSYFELNSFELENKIFWRNVQQFGVFIIPISNLLFAVEYTKQTKLKKYVYILFIIPITALLLIFTNEYHHIMRSGYALVDNNLLTKSLVVNSTFFSIIPIAFNYIFQLITLLIFFEFATKVSGRYRKQIYMIIVTIVMTLMLQWIRTAYLNPRGIYIPMVVLYIPCIVAIFFIVFRYKILNITPIARDKVFDIINEGIIVVDHEENIVDLNRYAIELFNNFIDLKEDSIGEKIQKVFHQYPQLERAINNKKQDIKEVYIRSENNKAYLSVGVYPLSVDDSKSLVGTIIIINDITHKKIYELGLKAIANKDELTGLLNRRGFSDAFNTFLQRRECKTQDITVFMIDIDFFKNINDTYRHTSGDKVLKHFAKILQSTLRSEDIISRVGGEEFAVALPGINKEVAFSIAERIRVKVEESKIIVEDKIIKYTVSIGIADNNKSDIHLDKLLHIADIALYEAKESSRNKTVIYKHMK